MKPKEWQIIILRLEHRPERDKRLTSHLGLTARAFGADEFWISGLEDPKIVDKLTDICSQWGFQTFKVCTGVSWRERIRVWKNQGGEIIHLTMYGLHIDKVINKIRNSSSDKLIIVGGPKVPSELYNLADDPLELRNLRGALSEKVAEFASHLKEWKKAHSMAGSISGEILQDDLLRLKSLGYVE